MNIIATQYTLEFNSFDIYMAGCKGDNGVHCTHCHNPETWNFNQGYKYDKKYFKYIKKTVKEFNDMIENIMIFGGEPLDQNHDELLHFLFDLKQLNKKIWIFTRYKIDDIPKEILQLCDYIKCGAYRPELSCDDNIEYGITLATSNQKIYKKEIDYLK